MAMKYLVGTSLIASHFERFYFVVSPTEPALGSESARGLNLKLRVFLITASFRACNSHLSVACSML